MLLNSVALGQCSRSDAEEVLAAVRLLAQTHPRYALKYELVTVVNPETGKQHYKLEVQSGR